MPQGGRRKGHPDPVDVEVGRRIRLQRQTLGYSQSKLAEALDLTFQQVQKYEKGANRVGASRLQKIAKFFDVPVQTFFGSPAETDARNQEPNVLTHLDVPGAIRLLRAYAQVNDPQIRNGLISLVESLPVRRPTRG